MPFWPRSNDKTTLKKLNDRNLKFRGSKITVNSTPTTLRLCWEDGSDTNHAWDPRTADLYCMISWGGSRLIPQRRFLIGNGAILSQNQEEIHRHCLKLTWLAGKSPFSTGNTSSNAGLPIAMLVFGRVPGNKNWCLEWNDFFEPQYLPLQ